MYSQTPYPTQEPYNQANVSYGPAPGPSAPPAGSPSRQFQGQGYQQQGQGYQQQGYQPQYGQQNQGGQQQGYQPQYGFQAPSAGQPGGQDQSQIQDGEYYEYEWVPRSSFNPCKCCCKSMSLRVWCNIIGVIEIFFGFYLIYRVISSMEFYENRTETKEMNFNNSEEISWGDWMENPYMFPIQTAMLVVDMLGGICLIGAAASVSQKIKILALVHTAFAIIVICLFLTAASMNTYWLDKLKKKGKVSNTWVLLFVWILPFIFGPFFAYFAVCSAGLFTQIRAGVYDGPPPDEKTGKMGENQEYHLTPYVNPYAQDGAGPMTRPKGIELPGQSDKDRKGSMDDMMLNFMVYDKLDPYGYHSYRGYGYGGYHRPYYGGYGGGGYGGYRNHGLFF